MPLAVVPDSDVSAFKIETATPLDLVFAKSKIRVEIFACCLISTSVLRTIHQKIHTMFELEHEDRSLSRANFRSRQDMWYAREKKFHADRILRRIRRVGVHACTHARAHTRNYHVYENVHPWTAVYIYILPKCWI